MGKQAADVLKFKCIRCHSALRVPIKLGGRYINCPRCQGKIPVPATQEEADQEGKPYDIGKLHFEAVGNCRKCGKKLRKGAVICIHCGFDYRTGKGLESIDRTKRLGDDVTYERILKSPFQKDVGQMASDLIGGLLAISITGGLTLLGLYLAAGILGAWLGAAVFFGVALSVQVLVAVGVTFFQGAFWFQTMVEACSKTALGNPTDSGGLIKAGLYHYAIRSISLAPLALVVLAFLQSKGFKLDVEDFRFGGPITVLFAVSLVWNFVYVTMAVAAFAVDATLNPLTVAYWFGRAFLDLMLMVGYFVLFILLLWGPLLGGVGYMIWLYREDFWIGSVFAFLFGVLLQVLAAYTQVSMYSMLGLILRKNSEW